MNPSTMRRFGAALVFSFATSPFLLSTALAGNDAPAPLHLGSRAKASDGTEVVYDAVGGVFVVLDRKDTFWVAPRFYHVDNGLWLAAPALAGPWDLVPSADVPPEARGHRMPPKSTVTVKLPSGRDAVYEPVLKVFRVAGRKGVFLHEGIYYRYDTGLWLSSRGDDGPWAVASAKALPVPLRAAVPVPQPGETVKLPSGETVAYDADAKVFQLDGKPETAFFEGNFYEKRDDQWFSSTAGAGPFAETKVDKVPLGVRFKFRKATALIGDKPKKAKPAGGGQKGAKGGKGKAAAGKNAAHQHDKAAAAADDDKESGE